MMTALLEDLSGSTSILIFPSAYEKFSPYLVNDSIVIIKGRVDTRNDEIKVVVDEIEPLERGRSLHIDFKESNHLVAVASLKDVLGGHRGREPVYFHLDGTTVLADKQFWVDINPQIVANI